MFACPETSIVSETLHGIPVGLHWQLRLYYIITLRPGIPGEEHREFDSIIWWLKSSLDSRVTA